MQYSEAITKRLKSLWDSQTGRAKEKKSKKGRVTRHGYRLLFDKQQFTGWLTQLFGAGLQGVSRCRYCNRPVDVLNCEIDHDIPIKRGGLPSLDNLAISCDACNPAKGELTGKEFTALLGKLVELNREFPDGIAVRSIMHRLQSYSAMKATVNRHRAQQFSAKTVNSLANAPKDNLTW